MKVSVLASLGPPSATQPAPGWGGFLAATGHGGAGASGVGCGAKEAIQVAWPSHT